MIKKAYNWIKDKIHWFLIAIGIVGVVSIISFGGPVSNPPSVIAEGKVISFPYVDDNSNENFIIRTDQQTYNPLWAWNGFDVYAMVENKSGKKQDISFQPFFSENFSVISVKKLSPQEKAIISVPVCGGEMIATATGSYCPAFVNQQQEMIGKWNSINIEPFSEENYNKIVSEKNIPVKNKGERIAKKTIQDTLDKNEIAYYKFTIKANQPFKTQEFDLEIIGSQGGYGLLDPTIFTENFDSYTDGDLNGQGSWSGSVAFDVQGTVVQAGAKAVQVTGSATAQIAKSGSSVADGGLRIYIRTNASGNNGTDQGTLRLYEGATIYDEIFTILSYNFGSGIELVVRFNGTNSQRTAITQNVWSYVDIEWRSSDKYWRGRVDGGAWFGWYAPVNAFTTGIDKIQMQLDQGAAASTFYFDEISAIPSAPPTGFPTHPQVIIIQEQ